MDLVVALIKIKHSGSGGECPVWFLASPSVLDVPLDQFEPLIAYPSTFLQPTSKDG